MTSREERVNIELSNLLAKRGFLSLPEQILKTRSGRRLPDVLIGIYEGIKVNIEGKFDDAKGRKDVEKQCKKRISENVAPMSIAVCYPPDLANAGQNLAKKLEEAKYAIKIFSIAGKNSPANNEWHEDTSKIGFAECDISGIAKIIKNCHQELILEDTVQKNVKLIEDTIDDCVSKVEHQGATENLNQIITTAFDGSS